MSAGAVTGSKSEEEHSSGLTVRLTLRARLALWAALATGLAVIVVAGGLYFAVYSFLQRAQIDRLLTAASTIQSRVNTAIGPGGPEGDDLLTIPSQQQLERIAEADPQIRDTQLRVITVQLDGSQLQVYTPRFPVDTPVNLRISLYQRGNVLVADRLLRGGQAVLTVVSDARALGDARRAFTRALFLLLPLALLLSLGVGWLVAGRLLRPVAALESAAQQVGAGGDLRRPLPGAGERDELSRLALTLQSSFGKLADSREREQSFLRAAAHDLRSPLAALQARVDGSLARERSAERYRSDLREVGRDITRLSTLTNHLLLLAREPAAMDRAAVPLRDLAAEAVDRARELVPEADVDLVAPAPVTVSGDRVLLGQAIWNLTMNAVKYAPHAAVTVSVQASAGGAVIIVQDNGHGVDAQTLTRLGEAFYRPDTSRSGDGHGLGLAIVRRAAHLHGGHLKLESSAGQGFKATLELPALLGLGHEST